MDKQAIFARIAAVFAEVFDDATPLTAQTVLRDLKVWDSMGQISFFAALENAFAVKFKMKDIVAFRTAGNIADGIAALL